MVLKYLASVVSANDSSNILVLNRFSNPSASSIFSKRLLLRSACLAALIALIYILQALSNQTSFEEEPAGKARIQRHSTQRHST